MQVLLLDDSFAYDGYTPRHDAMSGPEKGLVHLAEALVRRGHAVRVRNRCQGARRIRGVDWQPLEGDGPAGKGAIDDGGGADLAIALRHPRLLAPLRRAAARALWLATPGDALAGGAAALADDADLRLVFMGEAHRATWPADDRRAVTIEPGVAPPYLACEPPCGWWPPRAGATLHPRAGLERLIDLWCRRIEPLVAGAELHLFSSLLAAAAAGKSIDGPAMAVFRRAEAAAGQGVVVRRPLPDADMAEAWRRARVHLHPGTAREAYAMTLAESQAAGCPGVTRRGGAAAERVVDSRSGFLAMDDEAFANCAVLCLKEDIVYRGRARDARDLRRDRSWDDAAADFEALAR